MIEKITPFAHRMVKEHVNEDSISVDCTCGNGNDTLFLSKLSKKVYAFDIQDSAIECTKNLLLQEGINNVEVIKDSHSNLDKHINEEVDCFMFNLGYLPGNNKRITTTSTTTIDALNKALNLLAPLGIICITVYTGHDSGKVESELLQSFCKELSSNQYDVLCYSMLNKNNSPYNIIIERIR